MKINVIKSSNFKHQEQVDISIKSLDYLHRFKSTDIATDISTEKVFKSLEDLFLEIYTSQSYLNVNQDILPPGVLYVDKDHVIFERPPTYQNLYLIPKLLDEINYNRDSARVYRIPIPWQVYIVKIQTVEDKMYCADVKMFFSQKQITSFKDKVFLPVITNFYGDGSLCRPFYDDINDIEKYPKNILGTIQAAYDWIWNSGSNNDLTINFVNFMLMHRNCNTIADVEKLNSIASAFSDYTLNLIFAGRVKLSYNNSSYYCSGSVISLLLEEWEKISLEKIIEYAWPNPCLSKNANAFYSNFSDDLLRSFLLEKNIDITEYLHYEDEDDQDSTYQCGEHDCSCMGYGLYDINEWHDYQYNTAHPEMNLAQVFSKFVYYHKTGNENYHPFSNNYYPVNVFNKLRSQLAYINL